MRKAIALVLCVVLALCLCATSLAAEIKLTSNPADLAGAGVVTLTFSITNTSTTDMTDFDITGYGGASGWPELRNAVVKPNGALEFRLRDVQVTPDMLGQALNYTIMWTENGEAKSQSVSIVVGDPAAETTQLEATRKASKTSGAKDEKLTLTYSLKNPSSTVSITDITLKDPIAGSGAIESGLTLAPGESRDITYEYTVGSADASSAPAFTYRVNGEQQTLSLEPLTITVVDVSVETTVTMGENTPEGILFSIVLKNTGNQNISRMQVTDELGNKVNEDTFTLEAGKERSLSYTVTTDTLRNVSFTITGTDALGQPYENRTRSYEAWPYVDNSLVSLSLVATVVEQLSEGGTMKVRFAIQNNSSVDMTNAMISEEALGVLQSQDSLPLGETILEQELQVGSPRELVFTLTAQDPSGAEHAYHARLTADYVALATPAPDETAQPDEAPSSGGGLSGTLLTVLIVLASLMAVAGIALLVLSIYEKKNNARAEQDDTIDPAAPVRFASQEGRQPAQPRTAVHPPAGPQPPRATPPVQPGARVTAPPQQAVPGQGEERRQQPPQAGVYAPPQAAPRQPEERRQQPPQAGAYAPPQEGYMGQAPRTAPPARPPAMTSPQPKAAPVQQPREPDGPREAEPTPQQGMEEGPQAHFTARNQIRRVRPTQRDGEN